jgi:hypothetical protein
MWHRHPDSSDDDMVPTSWPVTITRDDLIRLVVGMQWREWFALFIVDGKTTSFRCPTNMTDLRPAVDVVDELLGVR